MSASTNNCSKVSFEVCSSSATTAMRSSLVMLSTSMSNFQSLFAAFLSAITCTFSFFTRSASDLGVKYTLGYLLLADVLLRLVVGEMDFFRLIISWRWYDRRLHLGHILEVLAWEVKYHIKQSTWSARWNMGPHLRSFLLPNVTDCASEHGRPGQST